MQQVTAILAHRSLLVPQDSFQLVTEYTSRRGLNGVPLLHYLLDVLTLAFTQLNFNGAWYGAYYTTNASGKPTNMSGAAYYHGSGSVGWNTRVNEDFLALVNVAVAQTPQAWYAFFIDAYSCSSFCYTNLWSNSTD